MRSILIAVAISLPASLAAKEPDWLGTQGIFQGSPENVVLCSTGKASSQEKAEEYARRALAAAFTPHVKRTWKLKGNSAKLTGVFVFVDHWKAPTAHHSRACVQLGDLARVQLFPSLDATQNTAILEQLTRIGAERLRQRAHTTVPQPAGSAATGPASAAEGTGSKTAKQLCRKGDQLMRQKRLDEAVRTLEMAVAANPRFAKTYRLLGMALWSQGKGKAALDAFEKFIALVPNHKDAPKIRMLIHKAR